MSPETMSDDRDAKRTEDRLRQTAAEAFRGKSSAPTKSSPFDHFEVSPEQSDEVSQSQKDLEEAAKARFGY